MTRTFLQENRLGNLSLYSKYANLSFRENWYKSNSRSDIFCGGVGVNNSPSFKTLMSSLLSGTLDKFNTFVEIGSEVCDVDWGSFFACICC